MRDVKGEFYASNPWCWWAAVPRHLTVLGGPGRRQPRGWWAGSLGRLILAGGRGVGGQALGGLIIVGGLGVGER